MLSAWNVLLPHLILTAGALLVFSMGAFWRTRPAGALLILTAATALLAGLAASLSPAPGGRAFDMLDAGPHARYFTMLICALTFLTVLLLSTYARERGFERDEIYALILLAALGMILLAGAVNWVIFFLALETLSLALYVVIAGRRGDPLAGEAAVKYFIMGAVASAFLLFGIALIYAATGTTDIAAGMKSTASPGTALAGLGFILVGLGFKASLAPFHLWTPDVYQGAPAPITAFLSTGSKVAVFAALLRLAMLGQAGLWPRLFPVLWAMAALTMVAGNLGALTQTHIKRMLGYSSVAHMGYLLMALLAAPVVGPAPVMFYAAVYGFMDLGAFGGLGLLSPVQSDLDKLADARGLGYAHPWTGALVAVSLLSLAGLPLTGGFLGKFLIFQAAVKAGFTVLAVIGILAAIASIYFYLRILVALYMHPESAPRDGPAPRRFGHTGPGVGPGGHCRAGFDSIAAAGCGGLFAVSEGPEWRGWIAGNF